MRATDEYTSKVADYITQEYGNDFFLHLLDPKIADVVFGILSIHETAGISVQDTAFTLVDYIKGQKPIKQ